MKAIPKLDFNFVVHLLSVTNIVTLTATNALIHMCLFHLDRFLCQNSHSLQSWLGM